MPSVRQATNILQYYSLLLYCSFLTIILVYCVIELSFGGCDAHISPFAGLKEFLILTTCSYSH